MSALKLEHSQNNDSVSNGGSNTGLKEDEDGVTSMGSTKLPPLLAPSQQSNSKGVSLIDTLNVACTETTGKAGDIWHFEFEEGVGTASSEDIVY